MKVTNSFTLEISMYGKNTAKLSDKIGPNSPRGANITSANFENGNTSMQFVE